MNQATSGTDSLYTALFEAISSNSVLLKPNEPTYTIIAVTESYLSATGSKKEDLVGRDIFEAFPANNEDPNHTGESDMYKSFQYVLERKEPHYIPVQRYDLLNEEGGYDQRYWRANNKPVISLTGEVTHIIHTAEDITDQVKAQKREVQIEGIEKAYQLFMSAPVNIGIIRGPEHIIDLANDGLLQIWRKSSEVVGRPLKEVIPELAEQGYLDLLNQVRTTGKPYYAYEYPIKLCRDDKEEVLYFDFVYKPFYESSEQEEANGVICVGHDVTEKVVAREKLEEVTDRLNFRNALVI